MKRILEQIKKTEMACNKASMECEELARLICVILYPSLIKKEMEDHNYPISDVIESINKGVTDIDMRDKLSNKTDIK